MQSEAVYARFGGGEALGNRVDFEATYGAAQSPFVMSAVSPSATACRYA